MISIFLGYRKKHHVEGQRPSIKCAFKGRRYIVVGKRTRVDHIFPVGKCFFSSQHYTHFILLSDYWIFIHNDRNCHISDNHIMNTAWKVSVFEVFLVRIFPDSNWIRRQTECLSIIIPNTGKYRPEKLRIRTLHAAEIIRIRLYFPLFCRGGQFRLKDF